MTFENCPECAGVFADLIQALVVSFLLGLPLSIHLILRSRRQKWCRLSLSRQGSE